MTAVSKSPRGIPSLIARATGVSGSIGLLEWLRAGWMSEGVAPDARGLLAVCAAYLSLGVLAGLASALHRRQPVEFSLCLPAGILVAVSVIGTQPRPLVALAGLSLGVALVVVGLRLVSAAAGRLPWLADGRLYWALLTLLLSLSLLLSLPPAEQARHALGLTAALGPAAGAFVMLLLYRRLVTCQPAVVGALVGIGLCLPLAASFPRTKAAATGKGPSMLLVTMDTTRADRLGAYGYDKARTPNLDALAKRGTLFRHVVTPTVFTGPSHASLLTGIHPKRHGFLVNRQGMIRPFPTLATDLGKAGYDTAAFPSAWPTTGDGLPDDFAYADTELREHWYLPNRAYQPILLRPVGELFKATESSLPYRPAKPTVDRAIRWLEEGSRRPFFTWVHIYDPHLPYRPPPELIEEGDADGVDGRWYSLDSTQRARIIQSEAAMAHMLRLYDAELAYADRELGRLFAAARKVAKGDLWIVVTADHGESMGEHGIFFNRDLYDPTLHIPLVIAPPKQSPTLLAEVEEQVRLIDVAPTMLEIAGAKPSVRQDGQSLLGLMTGASQQGPPRALSVFVDYNSFVRPAASVRTNRYKLIERQAGFATTDVMAGPQTELYDLETDPGENLDLSDKKPEVSAQLRPGLAGWDKNARSEHELSAEDRERLKALGYVQ